MGAHRVFTLKRCAIGGALAIAFALIVAVVLVVRDMPRAQLVGQTTAHLNWAISLYIARYGRMPSGPGDLEAAGILERTSENKYRIAGTKHILYALDELSVTWSFEPDKVLLVGDRVVDRASGEPVYVIRPKRLGLFWRLDGWMSDSVRLYRTLVAARAATRPAQRLVAPGGSAVGASLPGRGAGAGPSAGSGAHSEVEGR